MNPHPSEALQQTQEEAEPAPAPRPRHRLEPFEVEVCERIVETPDTVTLVFDGVRIPPYEAGQFLTIDPHQFPALIGFVRYFEDVKARKEPVRAYSMASSPHEKLAVTIKEEPYSSGISKFPPLFSPFLVRSVFPGTRMTVTGFSGHYTLPADIAEKTDHLVHVCAGSGIVPSFSIIKDVLARRLPIRQTLIYGNRSRADVIFGRQLEALAERHPDRFHYVQSLTREKDESLFGGSVRKGRVSRELIEQVVPDHRTAHFYVCGPGITPWERRAAKEKGEAPTPRFIEAAVGHLKTLGVGRDRLVQEAYG